MTRSDAPIRIELAASRLLAGGLAVAALLSVLAVLYSGLSVPVALACVVGAGLVVLHGLRAIRGLPGTVLRIEGDGAVNLRDPDGSESRLALSAHVAVGPLVVLTLRPPTGRTRRVPVARDAVDAGTWRRLRVFVAHHGGADSYKP